MKILVTGGAGFIGSALIRRAISDGHRVLNVDKLTYASSLDSVASVANDPNYGFARADICDRPAIHGLFDDFQPSVVIHLAAESHVDRSIDAPGDFIETNITGTFVLLSEALRYWRSLPAAAETTAKLFRFVHVSTDEVFGALGPDGFFTESSRYQPNSPYSASKASADHLARAWHETYGLPVVTTNCCNNYGPYQFPEKLIPLVLQRALSGESIPVYGDGSNIRDWIFVDDHTHALLRAATTGEPGQSYLVGGRAERTNLDLVRDICHLADELHPSGAPHERLITFVTDRPGHDFRYAIDPSKAERELGWHPRETLASGLRKTVEWYLANQEWCHTVQSGQHCGKRLGLAASPGMR